MYKRDAIHWNYLAKTYARPWQKPISERWGNAVLYGKFPVSKAYNGILKIGVHEDGFSLRVRFPLISYFCEPLFIPFRDVRGWDQTWYLNSKTVELELAGAPVLVFRNESKDGLNVVYRREDGNIGWIDP